MHVRRLPCSCGSDLKYAELEAAIAEVMTNKPFNLLRDEKQIRKMMQLKESLDQRMGCVVVGPSGCGKSTLWRILQAALEKTGQRVITHVMNPKSMPRQRLLGEMDPDTREWFDGVLTAAARAVVKEPLEVPWHVSSMLCYRRSARCSLQMSRIPQILLGIEFDGFFFALSVFAGAVVDRVRR